MFRLHSLIFILSIYSVNLGIVNGLVKSPWHPRRLREVYDEFVVAAGSSIQLGCGIEEYPGEIYASWIRSDNSSLPANTTTNDGTLHIKNIQPSAAGLYYCLGKSSKTHSILFTLKARLRVIVPPHITLSPRTQIIRSGDKVVISCTSTGDQPIEITWSVIGRKFPETVQIIGNDLQFPNIQPSDAGRYKCTASNSAGEAEAIAEIVINE